MRPPNLEILAYEPSPLGVLCLRRRELLSRPGTIVTEITLNHEFLMSSFCTDSERALANIALKLHTGDNLQVLVGGLGLGYTAWEALRDERVSRVDVIEYLPQVMDWLARGLVPLSSELNDDPRCHVMQGDVYAWLAREPERTYDLILIDVDHSPAEQLDTKHPFFYTAAGLTQAKRHLATAGTLGVWSYAESSSFADALRQVFSEVVVEPVTFESVQGDEQTDWLFFARE